MEVAPSDQDALPRPPGHSMGAGTQLQALHQRGGAVGCAMPTQPFLASDSM